MLKKEVRKIYKNKREELSMDEVEKQSIAIANQLLKLNKNKIWDTNLYFHLFLSIQEHKEINTEHILNILFAKDKEVVISKSDFELNYVLLFCNMKPTGFVVL